MDTNTIADIRDIKGLVAIPINLFWPLVVLVFVAAVVAFWIWWRRRAAGPVPAVPVRVFTAYELALQALEQLRAENPPVEVFYTRLSDIVRQYLEGHFGLRAPERTTEEFLYEVSRDDDLTQAQKDLLGAFLQEADLVKFARFCPGREDMNRAMFAAEQFVRETGQPAASTIHA